MGNASTLAYDIGEQVEYNGLVKWSLHDGLKKADKEERESVGLFRISKTANLVLAQRSIQKLRTLKHPFVLKFIETAEMDDSLALVTEPCVPLQTWLVRTASEEQGKSQADRTANEQEDSSAKIQEILWGLKCVLLALNFVHSNCALLHGNLGLHSIFVTPNGDWKLSGFELAGNMNTPGDIDHFLKYAHLLDSTYCSGERTQTEALKAKSPPFYIDMYSFGQCIQKVFNALNLEIPRSFGKYLSAVLHTDMKKRPTAQKLVESAMFHSEHLTFIESIGELSLKGPKEFLDVLGKMEPKVAGLSRAVCGHKILPNMARTLQIAINDFPLRDAREGCRQSIQVSINMLSKLAAMGKLDPVVFRSSWVPILVQLWTMSDRSVRTVMLQSLKALIPYIPDAVVNRSIFDNVLAGFSDSNAKLRESTLMSLIFIVDKLEETQLQDRLVRSIVTLQNDAEPSIRTNATIFLGKIAIKLKEPVRARVLCPAFQKAMKDNFMHCRVAGLRTSNACVKLLDVTQMASKLIPQASILLLDKSAEVRSLSLTLIESCLEVLRANHEQMCAKTRAEGGSINTGNTPSKASYGDSSPSTPSSSAKRAVSSMGATESAGSTAPDPSASSWSSWSVLQGISKSIESATIVNPAADQQHGSTAGGVTGKGATNADSLSGALRQKASSIASNGSDSMLSGIASSSRPVAATSAAGTKGKGMFADDDDGLDFDPDMHDHEDEDFDGDMMIDQRQSKHNNRNFDDDDDGDMDAPVGGLGGKGKLRGGGGWDDDLDLDDLNIDGDGDESAPVSAKAAPSRVPAGMSVAVPARSTAATAPSGPVGMSLSLKKPAATSTSNAVEPPAGKPAKAPKVMVKKLSVSKEEENWDDF